MAISTILNEPQTVSSDLESLFFVFLYWVSDARVLHWKRQHLGTAGAHHYKWAPMTEQHFWKTTVLARIQDQGLRVVAERLRELFFGPFHCVKYNKAVTVRQFLEALEGK